MTDRLRAVEIELANLQSDVSRLRAEIAMLRRADCVGYTVERNDGRDQHRVEKPLDPSIPIWQR